ncbi:MAG: TonB family protein [Hyphomicrobiaceae bacterium]
MTLRLETPGARVARWSAALAIVGLFHGGVAAWAFRPQPQAEWESQTAGAFIVELDPITASPTEENPDIATGKKSEEVAAVAASTPQVASVAKPVTEDQPKLPEVEDPPPDAAVAKQPDETPTEDVKPPEASAALAKDAPTVAPVEASQAAAPQKIDNAKETSATPRGQSAGLSRLDRIAIQNWQRDLVVHINRYKRFPASARAAHRNGVVTVTFALDRAGRVVRATLQTGSGFKDLDDAAVAMIKRASPLPPPPNSVMGETIEFAMPVKFRWKD